MGAGIIAVRTRRWMIPPDPESFNGKCEGKGGASPAAPA